MCHRVLKGNLFNGSMDDHKSFNLLIGKIWDWSHSKMPHSNECLHNGSIHFLVQSQVYESDYLVHFCYKVSRLARDWLFWVKHRNNQADCPVHYCTILDHPYQCSGQFHKIRYAAKRQLKLSPKPDSQSYVIGKNLRQSVRSRFRGTGFSKNTISRLMI